MALRIYLTGRVTVEGPDRSIAQEEFPGNQGLLAFARLASDSTRAVSRDELAAVLWRGERPRAWDAALQAVLSKLRGMLANVGLEKSKVISSALGCYQLQLPADTWLDVDAASHGIHDAEGQLKAGKWREAWSSAQVAYHVTRRPFLPGEEGPWVEEQRDRLLTIFVRACECLADTYIRNSEPLIAVDVANEVVKALPFRETGYQALMRAHAAAGNRADALWVYERCRKIISEELGVAPSPETNAVYMSVLRSRG